jgi:hypothetical protein
MARNDDEDKKQALRGEDDRSQNTFSLSEVKDYIKDNLPKISEEMDKALAYAMSEMSFMDSNHGESILGSVMEYMRREAGMDAVGKARLGDEPINHEKLVAAMFAQWMTRHVFEGMIAAGIIEHRLNGKKKVNVIETQATTKPDRQGKKNKKKKRKKKK